MEKESSDKIYINEGNQDILNLIHGKCCEILDLGCGNGALAEKLSMDNHKVDGVTISEKELIIAGAKMRSVVIHNLETGLPIKYLENKYDYAICSHVLEHIAYPANLLKDINRVLKPGGSLIVALPNIMHYKSRFQLFRGNFN